MPSLNLLIEDARNNAEALEVIFDTLALLPEDQKHLGGEALAKTIDWLLVKATKQPRK